MVLKKKKPFNHETIQDERSGSKVNPHCIDEPEEKPNPTKIDSTQKKKKKTKIDSTET